MRSPRRPRRDAALAVAVVADGARAAVAAGALVFALGAREDATISMLMGLPPIFAARVLRRSDMVEPMFVTLLAAYSWGTALGLLEVAPWADTAAHVVLPFLAVLLIAPVMGAKRACAVVAALAVAWELAEHGSDLAFGTSLAPSGHDTAADACADAVAILAGFAVLQHRFGRGRGGSSLA
jgi:hypothetical protein